MNRLEAAKEMLRRRRSTWLVTGAAGFIGSHLLQALMELGQDVVGLDNYSTGSARNVEHALAAVGSKAAGRLRMKRGDVRDPAACRLACEGVDIVLHHAALRSATRSIDDPVGTHDVNVGGFLNVLEAARAAGVSRVVYASSAGSYGDHPRVPKVEHQVGQPLSPCAAGERASELYAIVFERTYRLACIGLRYFNVFGPRQRTREDDASVIPRWIDSLLSDVPCQIFGDGETTRDYCFVGNVVQANLLAATAGAEATGQVYNVGAGAQTSLNTLFTLLRDGLAVFDASIGLAQPSYRGFRPGDVRHSLADLTTSRTRLGYEPTHSLSDGLRDTLPWYARSSGAVALESLA